MILDELIDGRMITARCSEGGVHAASFRHTAQAFMEIYEESKQEGLGCVVYIEEQDTVGAGPCSHFPRTKQNG